MVRSALCSAWIALAGCGGDPDLELRIDLKTDFVPGVEFTGVRVEVHRRGTVRSREALARRGESWIEARRVAEIAGLSRGEHEVWVRLFDAEREVASRRTILDLRGDHLIVVVIGRACRDVDCPTCVSDDDCPMPIAECATGRCEEGTCLFAPVAGACGPEEWCRPEDGCTPLPGIDAGVPDAGTVAGPCLPNAPTPIDFEARPPPMIARPAPGATYVDPTFGTTIRRITSSGDAEVGEPWLPAFNADDTLLLVREGASSVLYDFDPATGEATLRGPAWPSGSHCRFGEAAFHHTNPRLIHCHGYDEPQIWLFDVDSRTETLVVDLAIPATFSARDLIVDASDRSYALQLVDSSGGIRGAVVHQAGAGVGTWTRDRGAADVGDVSFDRDGRYVVLHLEAGGYEVWEPRTDARVLVARSDAERACTGARALGHGTMINADCYEAGFVTRSLATPGTPTHIVDALDATGAPRWSGEAGISAQHGARRFWLLVEWVDSAGARARYDPWEEEIIALAVDGSWAVPLAHHRSDVVAGGYRATPGATISYTGRWIAFTSNFDGLGTDVYVMRVPPDCP